MSAGVTYEAHPLADLIPVMSDEEYARLRDDVAANGLLDAIVLHEGRVLDGRHRLRACEDTATEPSFAEYGGDSPAQFVLSHNLHRRHLSVSQRAMIATDFVPYLREELSQSHGANLRTAPRDHRGWVLPLPSTSSNEEPQGGTHGSHEQAAKIVGVGHATVTRANRVVREDPELADRVRSGEVTVTQAHEIVRTKASPPPESANGHVSMRSIQRIASQIAALAMAIDAVNLTKSCARLSDEERAESLQDCKTGLKALNALANALGR